MEQKYCKRGYGFRKVKLKLPPDPEGMNAKRADWAAMAVGEFMQATRLKSVDGIDTAVTDLLCDLRHMCDRRGLNFEQLDLSALRHYTEETTK